MISYGNWEAPWTGTGYIPAAMFEDNDEGIFRCTFTMDPKCCKAVTEAFVRLHEDGTSTGGKKRASLLVTDLPSFK